jgi:hypothetical protein
VLMALKRLVKALAWFWGIVESKHYYPGSSGL